MFNFRKITAIATSVLLTGMTLGVAAAASYPAPFVSAGTANVAIVYGTGEGVSTLDLVQAGNIQSNLQSKMGSSTGGSSGSVTGGDSYKFEKSSTKFHLGNGITDVISTSLTDDQMANLLADGTFVDDDNDEFEYSQKISVANETLTMFEDSNYKEDEPVIGFKIDASDGILNYTLEFSDEPDWDDLPTATITMLGKSYYILSVNTSSTPAMTLLDSAITTTLGEGETTTLDVGGTPYEVSINFIGSSTVKLEINGETTNTLSASQTQKLSGGAYIGVREINTQDYAGGIKNVEFSIGKGKLKITNATDVELNEESITDLTASFGTSANLKKIMLDWKAEDDLFVTPDTEITMPGFEVVKLSFAGMVFPTEETIEVKKGGDNYIILDNFPLADSTEDIAILYGDVAGSWNGSGKDANNRLRTAENNETFILFDADLDDYFVASWSDGSNYESYLMRATNFALDSLINETDIQYKKDGSWVTVKEDARINDVVTIGSIELTLTLVNKSAKSVWIAASSSNTNFNTLYSKEGMKVHLPYGIGLNELGWLHNDSFLNFRNGTVYGGDLGATVFGDSSIAVMNISAYASQNDTRATIGFSEEDKDGNIARGDTIKVVLGWDSDTKAQVYNYSMNTTDATATEILDTDVTRDFVYSALATEVLYNNPSSGQDSIKLIYHGDESYAEVYLAEPGAVITSGTSGTGGTVTQLGEVLVKDSEVSSVSTKNLIIVGGSCINSAAAKVLGGAYCGAGFTDATGVGSGEYLIKGVSGAYSTGKIALVVAGYEAPDTVNAAKYLTSQVVDTSKEYVGTSSTSATEVTA